MNIWQHRIRAVIPDPNATGTAFDESACEVFIAEVVEYSKDDENIPEQTRTIEDGWIHMYDVVTGEYIGNAEIGYAQSRIIYREGEEPPPYKIDKSKIKNVVECPHCRKMGPIIHDEATQATP